MTDEAARADHADAAEQKLLVLDDVKVHFPIKRGLLFDRTVGHVYAVDGVSLHVNRGETYGLVGELGDHPEVVGDEDDRGAELLAQRPHQLEDLRLDRHVERGGRLVGDEQLRVAGERHGDHHALAHAAGELVRVLLRARLGRGDAHLAQHVNRLFFCLCF